MMTEGSYAGSYSGNRGRQVGFVPISASDRIRKARSPRRADFLKHLTEVPAVGAFPEPVRLALH